MPPEHSSPWSKLFEILTRRRLVVLALSAVTAAICALSMPAIPFETDPASSLPGDSDAVRYWVDLSNRFEAFTTLMIGLEEPGEGLSAEGLTALQTITNEVDQLKEAGVRQARSLSNMQAARRGPDGTLDLGGALESIPETPEARAALAAVLRGDPNLRGSFASADGRAYLIIVQLEPDRAADDVTNRIREVVEAHRGPLKAVYFGAPFVGDAIRSRLAETAPRVAGVGAILFLVSLLLIGWRLGAILVVLLSTGASLSFWFGLLSLLPIPITAETGLAALAVTAVGMALFSRAAGEQACTTDSGLRSLLAPRMLLLTLGAGLALGAVALVSPQPVSGFALAAAVGMLAILLAALLVFIPAGSWLCPGPALEPRKRMRARPVVAVILGLAVLGVGLLGATQGSFRTLPRQLFFKSDPVGRAISFFDMHFGGADLLQIHAEGDYTRPEDVARLLRLTDCLEGTGTFSDVRSLGQVLAFLGYSFDGTYRIPKEPEALGRLWFFLEGNDDIRSLVTKDRKQAMIAARIPADRMGDLEGVIASARRAVSCSVGGPGEVARDRLEAVRQRLGPRIPAARVGDAVDAVQDGGGPASAAAKQKTLERLQAHATSPEAPFEPTQDEWAAMAALLAQDGDIKDALIKVIAEAPGFVEMEYPDGVAASFADELLTVRADAGRSLLVEGALEDFTRGVDPVPDELTMRATGILADLQDGVSTRDGAVEITISGSPVVAYALNAPVVTGVWKGAVLIWVLLALFAWLITRRTQRMIVVSVEVGVATLYTFTLGWFLGIDMDPASAPLYLLAPLVGYFVTPWLSMRREDSGPAGNRFVSAFTIALALGALSLLQAGVLPLVRVGAVTGLGLLLVTLSSAVFRRISD
jgi:predicted RND superfamily exporter protein